MAAIVPVPVSAIFMNFEFPERLNVLIEGESLLKDGTAVIVFMVLSAVVLEGATFSFGHSMLEFVKAITGAVIVGVVLGGEPVYFTTLA